MGLGTTRTPSGAGDGVAGTFLASLASQDFARLGLVFAPDVHLRALLPGGLQETTGSAAVAGRFARWFGDTEHFDVLECFDGELGGRIHLRWRLRLRAERLGRGPFVVEQVAYVDLDGEGRIGLIDLLCTGYLHEVTDG